MPTATEAPPCIGVVLAGGQSRRMGRDKALLTWQGRALIEHQMALLEAAGVDEVRVSGERPAYHGIADVLAHAGPLAGIAGVAQAITGDAHLLVIPVDMPLLTPALLSRLRTAKPQATCLIFSGHILPLRLRVNTDVRQQLITLLDTDEPRRRSLRALQQAIPTDTIALHSNQAAQLTDCNTPTLWHEASA